MRIKRYRMYSFHGFRYIFSYDGIKKEEWRLDYDKMIKMKLSYKQKLEWKLYLLYELLKSHIW